MPKMRTGFPPSQGAADSSLLYHRVSAQHKGRKAADRGSGQRLLSILGFYVKQRDRTRPLVLQALLQTGQFLGQGLGQLVAELGVELVNALRLLLPQVAVHGEQTGQGVRIHVDAVELF